MARHSQPELIASAALKKLRDHSFEGLTLRESYRVMTSAALDCMITDPLSVMRMFNKMVPKKKRSSFLSFRVDIYPLMEDSWSKEISVTQVLRGLLAENIVADHILPELEEE